MPSVEPFTISVRDAVLDDLRARLAATRWPSTLADAGWDYGTDIDWLRDLCAYWCDEYDWRASERTLNALPNVVVDVEVDGMRVHAVHTPGVGPDPLPLVITHGWPSTYFEMHKVIGPLSDPAAYGDDPADAFHVVAPSLPGYGFSSAPNSRGFHTGRIADLWVEVMAALGYDRFGSHGGDWGSAVTTGLGARHPDRLVGMHLSMLAPPIDVAALTDEQREWWAGVQQYRDAEWGYVHLQRTKPQTASFALTDSPVGLAAWILEKWWRWSDIADEHGTRDLYRVYTRDELLTTVMLYWVTGTIGSSMRLYRETFGAGSVISQPPKIMVPTGVATFNEANRARRELAEPFYNIVRWVDVEHGGHFPAMENPGALVDELRAFFRPLRARR